MTTYVEPEQRISLERYELVFKATNDVLYDINLKDSSVYWNDSLYTQYGYPRNDRANTLEWWASRIHPDDALAVEGKFSEIFDSATDVTEANYRFRKADGTYAEVLDRGYLMRDKKGLPVRIIGSLLDVTETNRLARAKDEFISLVSHQLRTPLTVIRFYSQMMMEGMLGKLTKRQAAHIDHIAAASTNLIRLVGDILNVSRIELEQIRVRPVPTDVNGLIAKAIKDVRAWADEKKVTIKYEADPTLPLILIDMTLFEQVLDNLLSNAIRYSRPKDAVVMLTFNKAGTVYHLTVKDNGIGIPASAQPYIFERFYRAENARKVIEDGTGLGLYYIRSLAQAFGGDVRFESQVDVGTAFVVEIPERGMVQSD